MAMPTKRTPAIEAEILRRLADAEPLAVICRSSDAMPCMSVWLDWCHADNSLAIAYARARSLGEEVLLAECLKIADTPHEGVETTTKADGGVEEKCGDMLGHRKLQIETRLKLLAKWNPKKWGEKIQQEHTGKDGGPISVVERRIIG